MLRQIILDTETTGLDAAAGHRLIEIGCIELNNRCPGGTYHQLLNPERDIDQTAARVHQITQSQLKDQPFFADICDDFLSFIKGAEILAHNAEFDIGFLDAELVRIGRGTFVTESECKVLDTLQLARKLHPGMNNSLDNLCRRYQIDYSMRDKHSALLDAKLLVKVYLAMTGGQVSMQLRHNAQQRPSTETAKRYDDLVVIRATEEEYDEHQRFMAALKQDT